MPLIFEGRDVFPDTLMVPGQCLQVNRQDETPEVMNIIIPKGGSKTINMILSLDGIVPMDLTGCAVEFTVKKSPTDVQADAVIVKTTSGGITIADPATSGRIAIVMAPIDTITLEEMLPMTFDVVVTKDDDAWQLETGVVTIANRVSSGEVGVFTPPAVTPFLGDPTIMLDSEVSNAIEAGVLFGLLRSPVGVTLQAMELQATLQTAADQDVVVELVDAEGDPLEDAGDLWKVTILAGRTSGVRIFASPLVFAASTSYTLKVLSCGTGAAPGEGLAVRTVCAQVVV